MAKYAGLDYGRKRIGIAISDPGGTIAFPYRTVHRQGNRADMEALGAIMRAEGVEIIVIGLPRHMDGTLGREAEDVQGFARVLEGSLGIPVRTWDERLTTRQSERVLLDANVSRKKRKDVIDKMAACLILQGFLDCTHGHGTGPEREAGG